MSELSELLINFYNELKSSWSGLIKEFSVNTTNFIPILDFTPTTFTYKLRVNRPVKIDGVNYSNGVFFDDGVNLNDINGIINYPFRIMGLCNLINEQVNNESSISYPRVGEAIIPFLSRVFNDLFDSEPVIKQSRVYYDIKVRSNEFRVIVRPYSIIDFINDFLLSNFSLLKSKYLTTIEYLMNFRFLHSDVNKMQRIGEGLFIDFVKLNNVSSMIVDHSDYFINIQYAMSFREFI